MAELFKDILPSIYETKKDVLSATKDYVPFMVNRALSYHADCLFDANEMNLTSGLDKRLQYLFLLNTVRPARRPYVKWAKPVESQDIEAVKMYFGYGDNEAQAALFVLTKDQLTTIKQITRLGESAK